MLKKIISIFLVVLALVAFAVPVMAYSNSTEDVLFEQANEDAIDSAGMSIQVGPIVRTFPVSQAIPSSINYQRIVGIRAFAGPIPRTGAITNNFLNGVLVSHTTSFSGTIPFVFYVI